MNVERRDFIVKSFQGAAYISFGTAISACQTTSQKSPREKGQYVSLYLEVTKDNKFILTFDKVEMGQGVITGQATLFGEEADIHPDSFIMNPATADSRYAGSNGAQITAGSSSTYQRWTLLREAGACYRQALIEAASRAWNVEKSNLETSEGVIRSTDGKHSANYAVFNELLSESELPKDVTLKSPSEFKYIGKFSKSVDRRLKSMGEASYGIDVDLKDKKVAIVIRCPVHGGKLKSFAIKKIKAIPEVYDAFQVTGGLAVICDKYYQTLKARKKLSDDWLEWDIPEESRLNSNEMFQDYRSKLSLTEPNPSDGQGVTVAEYEMPYLAHAPMEPQNCTVWKHEDRLEMWVPTQSPSLARNIGAALSDLSRDRVIVHTSKFLGGGFGRRTSDSIIDAVEIANKVKFPVQVIWSREDDMRFSALRPMAVTRMVAVSKGDKVTTWKYQTVSQSLIQDVLRDNGHFYFPEWVPSFAGKAMSSTIAGAMDLFGVMPIAKSGAKQPYDLPYDIETEEVDAPIPTVFWRSVGNSLNGFFMEGFIDEVANTMRKDPLEFRKSLLKNDSRALAVIEKVAELAHWNTNKPTKTRALGLAYHFSYKTHCAQIADVEILNGQLKIHRIVTVVDCGTVVNPHIVENQVRSAVIYGLSAAIYGEITFNQGSAVQTNFDRYPVLRISETPDLEVFAMPSKEHPTGIGEPGLPAVAAAVCNAIFRASGKRIRKLPLKNRV